MPSLMAEGGRTVILPTHPAAHGGALDVRLWTGLAADWREAAAVAVLAPWWYRWAGPVRGRGAAAGQRFQRPHPATRSVTWPRSGASTWPTSWFTPRRRDLRRRATVASADEAAASQAALGVDGKPRCRRRPDHGVLLVVDATSRLWPVTVAAAVLRGAVPPPSCRCCSSTAVPERFY